MILDAQGRLTIELKCKHDWDKADNKGCEANTRALFSIFNGVCPDEFQRLENCKRPAWDILQVTHEGTSVVKISKCQMLATKFENIRMYENQTFFPSFDSKLSDIVNSSFNLGKPILDSKVVRRILRYLLEIFKPKVTTIWESKDIDFMRVDELVSSVQTYKMTLPSS